VGTREPYYASSGTVMLQAGKDLTEVATLIGTGGIFAHNPYAGRVMAPAAAGGRSAVLRPTHPRISLDQDYVLYAVGLLADSHPEAALQIFEDHVVSRGHSQHPGHVHPAGPDHDHCCCD
jgi:hypothetical protein